MAHAEDNAGTIKNIQIPVVRFVYTPDWLVENVIKQCCDKNKVSVYCIDTTYNMGPFYVTPTTYSRKDILHRETKKPAAFPGPALIHTTKEDKDFHYFASTLIEINQAIKDCLFIGGDRDAAQKFFANVFPDHSFIPCTKHVKDDISRKLTDLHLTKKATYIKDIQTWVSKPEKKG